MRDKPGILPSLSIGDGVPQRKLMDLKVDERCWVVGTFFKKMDLKPTILKEISATVCT